MKEQLSEKDMVPRETAEEDVSILTERIALLYYSFVQALLGELGEERTREITKKAIASYGTICGARTAEKVVARGLEPTLENYGKGKDLPSMGWKKAPCSIPEGLPEGTASKVEYCPFAEHWKDMDFAAWGRLYCGVDQAKYAAYGKGYRCVHDKNTLDGDDCCIIRTEKEGLKKK